TVTIPSFNDTGLTSGLTYSYTVTAVSSNGESAPSSALQVTTPDVVAPSVPANVHTTTVNVNQVVLAWNNSTDNVGIPTYQVLRDNVVIGSPTTNTFTDGTVAPGTSYSYTVVARDAAGNTSAPSTPLPVTTPVAGDVSPPSVPQNLHQTSITGTSVSL